MSDSSLTSYYSPSSIDWWRRYLQKGCEKKNHSKHHYSLISNLGYNLQYIEFLDHQCREQDLHFTVRTLTYKSFVISCMSVIEGLAFYLLTVNEKHQLTEWDEVQRWISNSKVLDTKNFRMVSILEKKLEQPIHSKMSLDSMIKKLEKHSLIQLTPENYKTLSYLRKLRNKVHVYDVSGNEDTDWNSFRKRDYTNSKEVLGSILSSNNFSPSTSELKKLSWLLEQ